ncbi:MAG: class I SAM-dependent methyltransferase [Candidatus Moranbacteria bacterium]|nr:class I SAM-dependent methyltransferase [Candidatus Moranbacteria bacterium]
MRKEIINRILYETESGYDQMADKFSHTRKNFWGDLAFIADYITDGDKILDYGCGNGRLLEILKDKKIEYVGVDISQKLIDLAKAKYPKYSQSFQKITGQTSLAFPADFFNRIISVAVFHHFPEKYATEMARELCRITKPGGTVVITAWNLWQKKRRKNIFNFSAILGKIFQTGAYHGYGLGDVLIPFRNNEGNVFKRYHRVYTKSSLSAVFQSAGFEIEKCYLANGKNIVLVARKK